MKEYLKYSFKIKRSVQSLMLAYFAYIEKFVLFIELKSIFIFMHKVF